MFTIDGLEYYGQLSFLKAGLFYSDKLSTVSPRYAKEIQTAQFGGGFDGLLATRAADLTGILNGADYDVWTPAADPCLTKTYTAKGVAAGKAANKAALQADMALDADPDAPLVVIVSRLNDSKGMDMVLGVLPSLLRLGGQLAVVGTGDKVLETGFLAAARHNPGRVGVAIGYDETLAHRMMAAGDILLMPSRFEPCGLTQLYALRYGTIPVAHATGGLADTVVDTTYDSLLNRTATGFVFEHANAGALQWSIERAVALYRNKKDWRRVQANGLAANFSWGRSAERYMALYRDLAPDPEET
jgi:starch synthase